MQIHLDVHVPVDKALKPVPKRTSDVPPVFNVS